MIWFNNSIEIGYINDFGKNTLGDHLGMQFTEIGGHYLKGTMPVDHRTKQPFGLLHGGASLALAETLGSMASALVIDLSKNICVGLEINANHIRSARSGIVTGTCSPIHLGASTHVWEIKIHNESNKLLCVSRITVAILKRRDLQEGNQVSE